MPTYVNPNKCDGCKALERPACMYICPMDLMKLDTAIGQENVYQRVFISHLLKDKRDANRIASAVGFFRGSYAIGPCVDNNWLALG